MQTQRCLWPLAGLLACTVSAENYPAQRAEAECALYEQCDLLAAFEDSYASCLSALLAQESAWVGSADCDYSGAAARQCVRDLEEATCDALRDAALEDLSPCVMVCSGS